MGALALLLAHALWAPAAIGIGIGCQRKFFHYELNLGDLGMLGIVLLTVFAMLANFFIPLNLLLSTAACLVGWISFIFHFGSLKKHFHGVSTFFVLLLWTGAAAMALGIPPVIDTEFYHLPSVMMNHSFSVTLGLINLMGPLATLTAWFPMESLFWLPGLGLSSVFSANSLLGIFFYCSLILPVLSEGGKNQGPLGTTFLIGCLLFSRRILVGVGGISPDCASLLFALYAWSLILRSFEQKSNTLAFAWLCALFALYCKLSALPIVMASFLIIFWQAVRKDGLRIGTHRFFFQSLLSPLGQLGLFLGVLAGIRGLLHSGCIVYPHPGSCLFDLSWSPSPEFINDWYTDVSAHIFGPEHRGQNILSHPELIKPLVKGMIDGKEILECLSLVIAGLLLIASAYLKRPKKTKAKARQGFFILGIVFFPGFLFWALTAPAFRFAEAHFLSLSFLCLGVGIAFWECKLELNARVLAGLLTLSTALSLRTAQLTTVNQFDWSRWPTLEHVESEMIEQVGEIKLLRPKKGIKWCGSLPAPCTSEPDFVHLTLLPGHRLFFTRRAVQD